MELKQINPAIKSEGKRKGASEWSVKCSKPLECEERQNQSRHTQKKREQWEITERAEKSTKSWSWVINSITCNRQDDREQACTRWDWEIIWDGMQLISTTATTRTTVCSNAIHRDENRNSIDLRVITSSRSEINLWRNALRVFACSWSSFIIPITLHIFESHLTKISSLQ